MKNTIRLTESQLHRVIKESVDKIVNEIYADRSREGIVKAIKSRNKRRFNKDIRKADHMRDVDAASRAQDKAFNDLYNQKQQVDNISDLYNERNPDNFNNYHFNYEYGADWNDGFRHNNETKNIAYRYGKKR